MKRSNENHDNFWLPVSHKRLSLDYVCLWTKMFRESGFVNGHFHHWPWVTLITLLRQRTVTTCWASCSFIFYRSKVISFFFIWMEILIEGPNNGGFWRFWNPLSWFGSICHPRKLLQTASVEPFGVEIGRPVRSVDVHMKKGMVK